MAAHDSNNHPRAAASATAAPRAPESEKRRSPWPLAVVAALFIIVPFLAWYGTWFGRELDEAQIEEYLQDAEKPRRVQHALSEIEKRITRGDAGARRWYPQIVAFVDRPHADLRLTAAWVMGADPRAEEFHAALLRLLEDAEPIVRRNAALSLVRFGDARSLPELRAMLEPYNVRAEAEGIALTTLTEGSQVRRGAMLLRAEQSNETFDVRSPLDGKIAKAFVKTGDQIRTGSDLFTLAPDPVAVGDALVALERLGVEEDLAEVEKFAAGVEGMPDYVKNRAARTAEAIKRRAERQKD
jgi:HEAT repeat protein